MNPMASTNAFLTLYSTVQTNLVGSTIATGYIPYVSTAGRQAYTNTLSTITVSTLLTNTMTYPSNTSNVATTAYVSTSTAALLSTNNSWTGFNTFNNVEIYGVSGSLFLYYSAQTLAYNNLGNAYTQLFMNNANNYLIANTTGASYNGVYLATNATSWTSNSDRRIKKNISSIPSALSNIMALNPSFFNYIADDDSAPLRQGFIAQDVQEIFPNIITVSHTDKDAQGNDMQILGLSQTEFIPYIVKAIQEQQAQITTLQTQLATLLGTPSNP